MTRTIVGPYPLAEAMHHGIKDSQMITFPGVPLFFVMQSKQLLDAITAFLVNVQA